MAVVRELDPETVIGHMNEADTSVDGITEGGFVLCDATKFLVLADPDDVPDVLDPFVMRVEEIWWNDRLVDCLLTAYSETSDTIEVFRRDADTLTPEHLATIEGSYGS